MKIIKYLLNFAGICLMFWFAYLSYALIVRFPNCDNVMNVIWSRIAELIPLYIIYLIAITIFNLIIERKVEKRKLSKDYLTLLIINLSLSILFIAYFTYDFYKHCGESS